MTSANAVSDAEVMPVTIAPLRHGGNRSLAARRFPNAPRPFLDLSTGINPIAYPLPPLGAAALTWLPDPEDIEDLVSIAARAYGVPHSAQVVAAPGTQVLISLLPRLFPHATVAVLGPTYAEHAASWRSAGATAVAADAAPPGVPLVLCNPNNPDGRRLAPEAVLRLADRRTLVVVDEAFADLEDAISVAACQHPSIIVLRSFGKTYGLAGVRLGFAIATPDRATAIRSALGPWAVSGPALAAGRAALADAAWLAETRARCATDAIRLDAILTGAGLRIVGGTRLFRLACHDDAGMIHDRLGHAGIMVRRFDSHPHWLRFGLPGADADWRRLAAALSRAAAL